MITPIHTNTIYKHKIELTTEYFDNGDDKDNIWIQQKIIINGSGPISTTLDISDCSLTPEFLRAWADSIQENTITAQLKSKENKTKPPEQKLTSCT